MTYLQLAPSDHHVKSIATEGYSVVMNNAIEALGRVITHLCGPEMVSHRETLTPDVSKSYDSAVRLHQMWGLGFPEENHNGIYEFGSDLGPLTRTLGGIDDSLTPEMGLYLGDLSEAFIVFACQLAGGVNTERSNIDTGNLKVIDDGLAALADSDEAITRFYIAHQHLLEEN
jgi:hypothetical protein